MERKRSTFKDPFREIVEDTPIIAAVKDDEGLAKSLATNIRIVFILYGDICSIGEIVSKIKAAGKVAMVHLDLVVGLGGKEIAIDFIKQNTEADGIITTKSALIKYAKQEGFYTVLRYFVMDSLALSNIEKQAGVIHPDVIEILPGVMPKVISKVNAFSKVPVIAGGLIADKEDVMQALSSGAVAISATNPKIWEL